MPKRDRQAAAFALADRLVADIVADLVRDLGLQAHAPGGQLPMKAAGLEAPEHGSGSDPAPAGVKPDRG